MRLVFCKLEAVTKKCCILYRCRCQLFRQYYALVGELSKWDVLCGAGRKANERTQQAPKRRRRAFADAGKAKARLPRIGLGTSFWGQSVLRFTCIQNVDFLPVFLFQRNQHMAKAGKCAPVYAMMFQEQVSINTGHHRCQQDFHRAAKKP